MTIYQAGFKSSMLSVLTLSAIVKEYDSKPFYLKIMVPPVIIRLKGWIGHYGPGAYLNAQDMTALIDDWLKNPQLFSKLNILFPKEFTDFLTLIERLHKANALTHQHIKKMAECHKTAAIENVLNTLNCVSDLNAINFLMCRLSKSAVIENIVNVLNNSKLLSIYHNDIIPNEQLSLESISGLLDSICIIENNCKVIMGGHVTIKELLSYFKNEETVCALIQVFMCMKKYALLNPENIARILKYTNDEGIIDLAKTLKNSVMQEQQLLKSLRKEPTIISINDALKQRAIIVPMHQRFLMENGEKLLVRGKDPVFIVAEKQKRHSK